jgi:methionyl-tRNA formyltransferase
LSTDVSCRVVVLSSTRVGRRCIEEGLLPLPDCTLTGIITTPAQIRISHSADLVTISTHAEFDGVAASAGCELVRLCDRPTTAAYLTALNRWQPDLVFVLGWYYLLHRDARAAAPLGCLGIHGSLLPKYRGGAPIPWAIINSERETGVTLFHLEDDADAGDIVAQTAFPIEPEDTCAAVLEKAADASIALLHDMVPLLARKTAPRVPQRHEDATWCPQRKPQDGAIDWRWPATRVHDFVRAQTRPYFGAFTRVGNSPVTVWAASALTDITGGSAGDFTLMDDALVVRCGTGSLAVRELGLPGAESCAPRTFAARLGARTGRFDLP